MSTPALVPDMGILCSSDIVAIETAALDMIKSENLLKNGLPKGFKLGAGTHLFEKIHGKDPYNMVKRLKRCYGGSETYAVKEIE